MDDGTGDAIHRRFTEDQKRHITGQYEIGNTARGIVASLRATYRYPPILVKAKDVNNFIQKANLGKMDGYTGTQAFIKRMQDEGRPYRVVYESSDPDRIAAVFWTYPWCIQMWRRFWRVASMDNTYKINRYKLPFMNTTGYTNHGTVFNMAFGVIHDETRESFDWLLQQYQGLLTELDIPSPNVLLSDFDTEFKAAAEVVLQDTQQQICIFHMNKNVIQQSGKKWVGPKEGDQQGEKEENHPQDGRNDQDEDDAHLDLTGELNDDDRERLRHLNRPGRGIFVLSQGTLPSFIPHTRNGLLLC